MPDVYIDGFSALVPKKKLWQTTYVQIFVITPLLKWIFALYFIDYEFPFKTDALY